jgi:phosphoglucomutase
VADEFTVANIRLAVAGIAAYVKTQPEPHRVLVGRDPRFLGESFVAEAAQVLAGAGVTPIVIPEAAPTPAIAYAVRATQDLRRHQLHRFAQSARVQRHQVLHARRRAGPARSDQTDRSRHRGAPVSSGFPLFQSRPPAGGFETADVKPAFLKRLAELVDLKAIAKSGIKVVYDPFWGAGRGYSPNCCARRAWLSKRCTTTATCSSAAMRPSPTTTCSATPSQDEGDGAAWPSPPTATRTALALSTQDGTFIQPNYIIALLFDYLVETRGWRNGVAKSVATTNLINALADYHKVPLYETPVGFKYIGELIIADKIAIGGEESAGLTIRGHVPEKDGIIAGLLVAEMVANRGKSLGAQLKELFGKVGSFYPVSENFRLTPEVKAAFTEKLKTDPKELSGRKVTQHRAHRRPQADSRRRFVGLLPALRNRACGARLH